MSTQTQQVDLSFYVKNLEKIQKLVTPKENATLKSMITALITDISKLQKTNLVSLWKFAQILKFFKKFFVTIFAI